MLALPHHVDILQQHETVDLHAPFQCIKGNMTPVLGTTWQLKVCVCDTLLRICICYQSKYRTLCLCSCIGAQMVM